MTSKLVWQFLRQLRKVWVRVVSFALLAVVTAGLAQWLAPMIPSSWSVGIGADAIDHVLNILASSMLAVTTFSLGIAISAFTAAANTATPRASALLQEDPTAQNVLATFLGAFLFSLVGTIALQAGYYSDSGRVVLFAATVVVITLVILALLRWISHLMSFGRMGDTLDRVEAAATASLATRLQNPYLCARPLVSEIPASCAPVMPPEAGYVLHIDIGRLDRIGARLQTKIWLATLPGAFAHPAKPALFTERDIRDADDIEELRSALTISSERSFDQDPRFGLVVLSEIASRALSPAVNDPGTAISVIGRLVRILSQWRDDPSPDIDFENVFAPPIGPEDLIMDAFRPIARDGAALIEVQLRLQAGLHALASAAPEVFSDPATRLARDAMERAREALSQTDYAALSAASAFRTEDP